MVRQIISLSILLTFLAMPLVTPVPAFAGLGSSGHAATGSLESGHMVLVKKNRQDRERDHDRARDAVGSGDVLPLREIMRRIGRRHPGRLLDADLGQNGWGQWIYRLKLLAPGDQVQRLVVDAQSGRVLSGGGR